MTSNGRYSARALYPDTEPASAEFHELRIAPLHTEAGARRAPGTTVNLVVSDGTLEVRVHERRQLLATGDAIVFDADQPHSLRNPGDTEARALLRHRETRRRRRAGTYARRTMPGRSRNSAAGAVGAMSAVAVCFAGRFVRQSQSVRLQGGVQFPTGGMQAARCAAQRARERRVANTFEKAVRK